MDFKLRHDNILNLRHTPIQIVRVGIIGLGNRGIANLKRYLQLELHGVEITALADVSDTSVHKAQSILKENNRAKASSYVGIEAWKDLCQNSQVNLVMICTDWLTHCKMATYAMECGKHVALEVPAAITVDECWKLVHTAEKTSMHCTMLENCCYDPFALTTLNMVRQGLLGEMSHVEGAYIHDLRPYYFKSEAEGGTHNNWTLDYCTKHTGNPYPTHGLGPISKVLDLNNQDYMVSLTSMSSCQQSLSQFAKQHYGEMTDEAKVAFKMGDMNTTLIKTAKGKTIMLQYSVALPRPYNRSYTLCGTKGFIQKYPVETITLDPNGESPLSLSERNEILLKYEHPFVTEIGKPAKERGIDNTMNYMMDYRLIDCLQKGLPLDISLYEAVQWSCIAELSEKSVLLDGRPVRIPNFLFDCQY